jgi:hypothetical protein
MDGEPLVIRHGDTDIALLAGQPQVRHLTAVPIRTPPTQPSGREPAHRRISAEAQGAACERRPAAG